ncbi:uncharacterized protein LOC118752967 [Rhagoletis pomonella]|uniref:uncharacterized protein LOC118752967 n=1 Tax=Rhagoletis pomonella TaxID=28610 RepID=UPI00177D3C08|nr:uncharacterized protein LOC118752967 [Rhagoletis pomonella]
MEAQVFDLERSRTSGDGMEEEKSSSTKLEHRSKRENDDHRNVTRYPTVANIKENIHRKNAASNATDANSSLPLPGLHLLYRRSDGGKRNIAPIVPKGELVQMRPRLVATPVRITEHKKVKPPKFIPYEPYPGATNLMVPCTKSPERMMTLKKNNNLDIGVLVSQMCTLRAQEMDPKSCKERKNKDVINVKLEDELRKTKEERDYYQAQFRFQVQVNSELKNLLVASVGEDLQTHVNVLTEDKLQLARALLDTAKNLTTHAEQIEFLAGQCEVWRSKFLASSVMVEELARWKADLTQKTQTMEESTKRLLHAIHQIREMQLEILRNLKFMAKIRYLNLPATDVISLSVENLNILQQMVLHSGVGIPEDGMDILSTSKNPLCEAEKYAVHALEFVSQPLLATDDAIKALFDQAQRPYGLGSSVR